MSHAFLPPSGASAWSQCALWPTMNRRYPQESGPAAIEGTAAHWVAWELVALLTGKRYGYSIIPGVVASNGTIVTQEMIDGGDLLLETIDDLCGGFADGYVEQRVNIPGFEFGTPDFWKFDSARFVLDIVDYKFGHGFVDHFFNPQGVLYAKGILAWLEKQGVIVGDAKHVTVRFTIVQPRCYYQSSPVRSHTYKWSEAAPVVAELEEAARRANEPNPKATTNKSCGDCPGRHACTSLQLAAYSDAEFADGQQPVELSPAAAALELRMLSRSLERLEARVDGLRELTFNNLRTGKVVPHYHLEPGKTRQAWNVGPEQVIAIGQMFGKELGKAEVITPKQALKAGLSETVIQQFTVTPPGSMKLVADNLSDVKKIFTGESL